MLLYLLGINGSSNGPPLLEFLATGLFLICLHLTKFNPQGLRLHCGEPVVSVRAGEQQASVSWTPSQRGEQRPWRLRIWSTAPMDLLYGWSVWEASVPQLVSQPWISGPLAVVGA